MANIPESPVWVDGVKQIETTDKVLGGPDGVINQQAKNLADRTAFLKQEVEGAQAAAASADEKAQGAIDQIAAVEAAAGSAQAHAADALTYRDEATAAAALALQHKNSAEGHAESARSDAAYAADVYQFVRDKSNLVTEKTATTLAANASTLVARDAAVAAQDAVDSDRVAAEAAAAAADEDRIATESAAAAAKADRIAAELARVGAEAAQAAVYGDLASTATGKGGELVAFKQAGSGAVTRDVQNKLREVVSVKDFGAVIDGVTDDYLKIQAAIDYVYSKGGGSVLIPNGTCKTSATIVVKQNVTLVGNSRFGSIISGISNTITAVLLNSPAAALRSLTVRDADIGVKIGGTEGSVAASSYYGDVYDCHIAYNRIGVSAWDSYMTSVHGCKIVFNGYGVIIRGQSYAMNIYDNEIGNCLKGIGVYISGSAGCIIRDNGIEGCRNITSNNGGVGLMILSSQRTIIQGNWFEANYAPGNIDNGVDVIIGNPADPVTTAIIANCIPTEYQSEATANSAGIYGPMVFSGNFHYSTKHGYFINSAMYYASVTIENPTFVGVKDRYNKAVRIKGNAGGCNVALRRLRVLNTADTTIDAQMNTGIQNTCVFVEGTMPTYGGVTLDGDDLLTKKMTMKQFAALPGATLSCGALIPTSGNASFNNNIRCTLGTKGVVSTIGTGRPRVTDASGNAAVIPTGIPVYGIALKEYNGVVEGISFQYSAGTAFISRSDGRYFNVQYMGTPTNSVGTYYNGTYFGYCFMTEADYATNFAGATRLQITDLQLVSDTTKLSAAPYSASQNCSVGDVVYNSAPASGQPIGWVCTVAGSPGTWKAFGTIA